MKPFEVGKFYDTTCGKGAFVVAVNVANSSRPSGRDVVAIITTHSGSNREHQSVRRFTPDGSNIKSNDVDCGHLIPEKDIRDCHLLISVDGRVLGAYSNKENAIRKSTYNAGSKIQTVQYEA